MLNVKRNTEAFWSFQLIFIFLPSQKLLKNQVLKLGHSEKATKI